jgi:hypothetical protein
MLDCKTKCKRKVKKKKYELIRICESEVAFRVCVIASSESNERVILCVGNGYDMKNNVSYRPLENI